MVGRIALFTFLLFAVGLTIAILSSIAAVTVPFKDVDVTEIRFRDSDYDSVQICVRDVGNIEEIVDTVRLRDGFHCPCVHTYEVAFVVDGSERVARLCSGCFNFMGSEISYYKMPDRFYEIFLAYRDSTHLEEYWEH